MTQTKWVLRKLLCQIKKLPLRQVSLAALMLSLYFNGSRLSTVAEYLIDSFSAKPSIDLQTFPTTRISKLFSNCQAAQQINFELLNHKLRKGLPLWAKQQIQEDLSPFEKIYPNDLDKYMLKFNTKNRLVRFQIKAGKLKLVSALQPLTMTTADRNKQRKLFKESARPLFEIFKLLASKGYLPDTDFIVGLDDYLTMENENALPIFTYAKDLNIPIEKNLILIPDWMNLCSAKHLRKAITIANKTYLAQNKLPVLFWRGGGGDSTGFRKKLIALSHKHPHLIDADFVNYLKDPLIPEGEQLQYKYLIAIDGSRGTWERFVWHLHSNSLVFKHQSSQIQWFYKGIKPYLDYIPISDESSLLEAIDWAEKNPDKSLKMIEHSTHFVDNNLTLEDMCHYLIALLQAYSTRLDKRATLS